MTLIIVINVKIRAFFQLSLAKDASLKEDEQ